MRQLVPLPVPLPPRLAPLLLPLLLPQLILPPVLLLGALPLQTKHRPDAAAAATFPQGSTSHSSEEEVEKEEEELRRRRVREEEEEEDRPAATSRRADTDNSISRDDTLAVGVLRPSNDRQQSERLQQPPQPPEPLQACFSAAGPMLEGVIGGASTVPMVECRGAVSGEALEESQRVSRACSSSESRGADLLGEGGSTMAAEAAASSDGSEQPWFRTADRSVKIAGVGWGRVLCYGGGLWREMCRRNFTPLPTSLSRSLPPLPPASSSDPFPVLNNATDF